MPSPSISTMVHHHRGSLGGVSLSPFGVSHSPIYSNAQFRRTYRYGLALLLIGALLNWIGFAQPFFAPIRYLGVGCVVGGALCVCLALFRWLGTSRNSRRDVGSSPDPEIHVITVPVQGTYPGVGSPSAIPIKPPDYDSVAGVASRPPSYEEAVRQLDPAHLVTPGCSSGRIYLPSTSLATSNVHVDIGTPTPPVSPSRSIPSDELPPPYQVTAPQATGAPPTLPVTSSTAEGISAEEMEAHRRSH